MKRVGVGLRIDRDGAQAEALGSARDAAGDHAAIGDQNGAEHGGRTLAAAGRCVSGCVPCVCGRDAYRTYCGGDPNGASCIGPAPPETKFAAGAVAAACAGGAGGAGVHTGSGCSTTAAGAGEAAGAGACAGGLAACLRDFFDGGADAVAATGAAGFGLAAAGAGLVPGSGFMMLTGGIDAAVGKSMLTILRGPGAPGW